MMNTINLSYRHLFPLFLLLLCPFTQANALEQRNNVSYLRGPYNFAFYNRHNSAYRLQAGIHFAHGKQHDVLLLDKQSNHKKSDASFEEESLAMTYGPPRIEPPMELYAPYSAQSNYMLFRAIDWTHMLHEQTYDILSAKNISWKDKKYWTDRIVKYYLEELDVPRSPAPLDITMRRAGTMMKPYFTVFRNYYPESNNYFFAAHWWHPVVYEAMMLSGNGPEQDDAVRRINEVYFSEVLKKRPMRMLLSREVMPRYSRLSPEAANAFDNLHMLHGIAYDIMAYDGWTLEQKTAEIKRVVKAMSYQPGDEELAAKFPLPRPDYDPFEYDDQTQGFEGEMNRIMMEMWEEMMPMMMPDGTTEEMKKNVKTQLRMKLMPGMEDGEKQGSLMEAVKSIMPKMKMSEESMGAGTTDTKMVNMMLDGWKKKHGDTPKVEPIQMSLYKGVSYNE
ncbi:MAG: hypothetical protein PHE18_02845 [Candidatus Omnitrophica bacterium]|nr:hypothetical protein [Candidatus Omnitrophota bacterium]